jgi:hypothetical protein
VRTALALLLSLAACDKFPTRPDEAKFRAADPMEKCKLTEPRAIRCTDELLAAELRSLGGPDDGGAANALAEQVEKDSKPLTKEMRHSMHKTACIGSLDDGYTNGVFDCWSISDCKRFAECVHKPSAKASDGWVRRPPPPTTPGEQPPPPLPQPSPAEGSGANL